MRESKNPVGINSDTNSGSPVSDNPGSGSPGATPPGPDVSDFSSLLQPEFDCTCGRKHRIEVDKIIIRDKALSDLPQLLHNQIQKTIKKEPTTNEATKKDAIKREINKNEAIKKEIIKKAAIKKEADNICQESEKQKAQENDKKSAQDLDSKPLVTSFQEKELDSAANQLVYLICDDNTYQAAARKAQKILQQSGFMSGFKVELIRLSSGAKPIKPTPTMLYRILQAISQPGWLLACGSGTINDLVKFAASRTGLPSGVLATAPSMDGYTSGVASLVVEGVKQTTPTGTHNFILADPEILAAAPEKMILAGVGDLLGKVTSLLDWHLRRIIFDEYFCQTAEELIRKPLENLLADNFTSRLSQRDPAALRELIRGLLNSGLAMELVGSSSPASGSEHHISHFLEMLGLRDKLPMPLHGIKVGLGTYFTAGFYLRLLEEGFEILSGESTIEEPITAEPKTGESTTSESTTEEPIAPEPKTSEPTTEEPKTSEPKATEPTTEEPKTPEPKATEPKTADTSLSEAFAGSWNSKEARQERIIQAYGSRQAPVLKNLQERWPRESSLSISSAQLEELKSRIAEFKPLLKKARQYLKRNNYFELAEEVTSEQLRQAVLHGFEIRQRFTITTLLYQLGWLEGWTESLLAEEP